MGAVVSQEYLLNKFQSDAVLFAVDMRDFVNSAAYGASMSQFNSTISSDSGNPIVLQSGTVSVDNFWISLVGRIPNDVENYIGSSITSDGTNIYVVGYDEGNNVPLLTKVNSDGAVVWQKEETTVTGFGQCIVYKNSFLWIYYTDSSNSGNMSFLQVDTDGNLIGQWNFTTDVYQLLGYDIDVDENNNIYFVGVQSDGLTTQMGIGCLSTSMNTITWSYTIGDDISDQFGYGIKYSNGFIYCCGYEDGDGGMLINKLDVNGNLIWSKLLSSNPSEGLGITIDNNGIIYISGQLDTGAPLIVSIDNDGNGIFGAAYSSRPIA